MSSLSSNEKTREGWPWHTVFGIVVWFIWKSRNEKVFGGGSGFSDYSIAAIRNMMVDTSIVNKGVDISGRKKSEVSWVGWEYSQEELFKLNVDGCGKGNPGVAGAGGLIRDSMGTWLQNFAVNSGICTSVRAELWAVVTGLDLAWTLGLCQVILDTDSILAVGLITKSSTKSDSNNALITQVKEALAREWEIRVQHTIQEGNTAADWVANYGSIKNPFIRDRWIVHDLSAGSPWNPSQRGEPSGGVAFPANGKSRRDNAVQLQLELLMDDNGAK